MCLIKDIFWDEISIHALREEGDRAGKAPYPHCHISIHALREEGDCQGCPADRDSEISIHALREEGDCRLFRSADRS